MLIFYGAGSITLLIIFAEDSSDDCGIRISRPLPNDLGYEISMCAKGVGLTSKIDANEYGILMCASEGESMSVREYFSYFLFLYFSSDQMSR